MTAGTGCISIAAKKQTTNWPMWQCQAACSRTVLLSALVSSLPSNSVSGHMSPMWFMVCRWPQSQEGDWARPYLCRFARHGPRLVRKWLNRDHVWRERLKPGCRIVGSVTIEWLTTEANKRSSLHCTAVSTGAMSDHIGHLGACCGGGCSKTSACMANWGGLWWFEACCQLALYNIKQRGTKLMSTRSQVTRRWTWSTKSSFCQYHNMFNTMHTQHFWW